MAPYRICAFSVSSHPLGKLFSMKNSKGRCLFFSINFTPKVWSIWYHKAVKQPFDHLCAGKRNIIYTNKCAMVKSRYIGDGHPTFNRNPYNGYINPYYWVDDHPLLYGNNGSLDPGTNEIGHKEVNSESLGPWVLSFDNAVTPDNETLKIISWLRASSLRIQWHQYTICMAKTKTHQVTTVLTVYIILWKMRSCNLSPRWSVLLDIFFQTSIFGPNL